MNKWNLVGKSKTCRASEWQSHRPANFLSGTLNSNKIGRYRNIPLILFTTLFNADGFFGFGLGVGFAGFAASAGLGEGEGETAGDGVGDAATFALAAASAPAFRTLHQRAASTPDPTITISRKIKSTAS